MGGMTWRLGLLACGTVLSSTLLIPAVRPFVAAYHGGNESLMHAFMSVNLLGGILGAPWAARRAEGLTRKRRLLVALCALDGLMLLVCLMPLPASLLLGVRFVQGGANLAGLSLIMGAVRGDGEEGRGRAMGVVGAAVMAGVALGSPLGAQLLRIDPAAPLLAAGLLQLAVAAGAMRIVFGSSDARAPECKGGEASSWWPALWVGAERFGVGCIVVSFALYAHRVHGLDDVTVGNAFSWFLVPFVALVYPLTRWATAQRVILFVALGMLGYGVAIMALGWVSPGAFTLVMLACGISSAAVYGASLRAGMALAGPHRRARAMARLNAAGSLGMLLGTALAGIASATLRRQGVPLEEVYPAIFTIAGGVQWVALGASLRVLGRVHGALRSPAQAELATA